PKRVPLLPAVHPSPFVACEQHAHPARERKSVPSWLGASLPLLIPLSETVRRVILASSHGPRKSEPTLTHSRNILTIIRIFILGQRRIENTIGLRTSNGTGRPFRRAG